MSDTSLPSYAEAASGRAAFPEAVPLLSSFPLLVAPPLPGGFGGGAATVYMNFSGISVAAAGQKERERDPLDDPFFSRFSARSWNKGVRS